MKSIVCASLIFTALVGPLQAAEKSVFITISETAPRSGVFEDLNLTAPKSIWDSLNETAPRSDGVFGDLEKNAP
jgi:hypothetical protein